MQNICPYSITGSDILIADLNSVMRNMPRRCDLNKVNIHIENFVLAVLRIKPIRKDQCMRRSHEEI